jgi:hypothetical protein
MTKRFEFPPEDAKGTITPDTDELHTQVIDELRKALSETLVDYMGQKLQTCNTNAGAAAIVAAVSKALVYQGGSIVAEMYRIDGTDPKSEAEMGLIIHNKFVEMTNELRALAIRKREEKQ